MKGARNKLQREEKDIYTSETEIQEEGKNNTEKTRSLSARLLHT